MPKQNGKERRRKKDLSRREFIRQSAGAGTAVIAGASIIIPAETKEIAAPLVTEMEATAISAVEAQFVPSLHAGFPIGERNFARYTQTARRTVSGVPRQAILFAMGDTLIPSAPGDPGYKDLEWYGITDEVNRRIEIADENLDYFNRSSVEALGMKFTDLSENQRADYFNRLIQGTASKDEAAQKKLKETWSHVREMVFTVYYQNFPEHSWPRDAQRAPLLKPGDTRQITSPNTTNVVTGWDVAGYAGPLTWEEEERRRNFFKKIRWQE